MGKTVLTPPPRRRSFDDTFLSPIAVATSPLTYRDEDAVLTLAQKGDIICRDLINPDYIEELLDDPQVELWLGKDAAGRILAFAFTRPTPRVIHLELVCSRKRKGEGRKLFANIAQYAVDASVELHLEATNEKVADMYAKVARSLDMRIYMGNAEKEVSDSALKKALSVNRAMIDMQFVPSHLPLRSGDKALRASARSLKKAMRLSYDSSGEESD